MAAPATAEAMAVDDPPPAPFQRVNVYNRHLVFAGSDLDADADAYFLQLMRKLEEVLTAVPLDCITIHSRLDDLQKYMILYGMRFSKENHIRLIRWHLGLLLLNSGETEGDEKDGCGLDLFCVEKLCKIVHCLLKKKYLIKRDDLTVEWRPLYRLYHRLDQSSLALRGSIRVYDEVKVQLRTLIKSCRGFFPEESTREMLDEWRPLLCSTDRSMWIAFKNFSLFLPTTSHVSSEHTYQLWFDELLNLWKTFGNGPAWEVELFTLWSRLALHNIGRIDWSRCVEPFFTRFMIALGLPVTYANSNLRISFGMSNNATCLTAATRWIVCAMQGGGRAGVDPVQRHLDKMLLAIESYFHPANGTLASEGLHLFVSLLCTFFVRRVHLERHNSKWETRTPPENRLKDEDISHFVRSLLPITFHVLYNNFEDDRRNIFNMLSTLRPELVIPKLVKRLHHDVTLDNTPNRFTACIAALSACSRTLVEHYPLEVVSLLDHLLPGINVNDMFKSTDIFIFISDLLDMIWMIDFSSPESRAKPIQGESAATEEENQLCLRSSIFEDFVLTFVERCLTLVEHSSREQTRQESDTMEESLNEEEIAADCTISDTFQKVMCRISRSTFMVTFDKIKRYVDSRILEPAVAGAIMAAICKACTNVEPELTLKFFVPHLCGRIETILEERVNHKKSDHELQYVLKLLSDVVSVRGVVMTAKPTGENSGPGSNPVLPYVDQICDRVLDKAITLPQKDEYELAGGILSNILFHLTHVRPVVTFPAQQKDGVQWSRRDFQWAKQGDLDTMKMEWYVPAAEVECSAAKRLIERYLLPPLEALSKLARQEVELDKESVVRNLKMVNKVIYGASELLPAMQNDSAEKPPTSMAFLDPLYISLDEGQNVRLKVLKVMHDVQEFLLKCQPDNTEALNMLVSNYETLMSTYGVEEEDLNDHLEDHKIIKTNRENKMVKSKKHLEIIQWSRILIQHECHMWLKNFINIHMLPKQLLMDVFELSVSHYSEVRIFAQGFLQKLLMKTVPHGHEILLEPIVKSLTVPVKTDATAAATKTGGKPVSASETAQNGSSSSSKSSKSKSASDSNEERFKGALHVLLDDRLGFFGCWKYMAVILPALIRAQGSDKNSIVELLKDHSARCNRFYQECIIYTMPVVKPSPTPALLALFPSHASNGESRTAAVQQQNGTNGESSSNKLNPDFVKLEAEICDLILTGNLHWRHFEMAVAMLYSLIVPGYRVTEKALNIWLNCLVHDDRTIRYMALQAVECLLKVVKTKRGHVYKESPDTSQTNPKMFRPGVREDNRWMQYDPELQKNAKKMEEYWSQPFLCKSHVGFYAWPKDKVKMRVAFEENKPEPSKGGVPAYVTDAMSRFFRNEQAMELFMKYVTMEHKKGEDFFSTDKAYFYSMLFELLAEDLCPLFMPRLKKLVESDQESEQRAAAEILYGIIHGTRFYPYKFSSQIAVELREILRVGLTNVTAETIGDWESLLCSASNKVDPNRIGWLYELLLEQVEKIDKLGAFKSAALLRVLNKAVVQNWKGIDLHNRTYGIVSNNCTHPYQKVRHQIAKLLAEVLTFDVKYFDATVSKKGDVQEVEWRMGQGFPQTKDFIDAMLPKLSLNFHNPELKGIVAQNGESPSAKDSAASASNANSTSTKDKSSKGGGGGGGGTCSIYVEKEKDVVTSSAINSMVMTSSSSSAGMAGARETFSIDLDEDSNVVAPCATTNPGAATTSSSSAVAVSTASSSSSAIANAMAKITARSGSKASSAAAMAAIKEAMSADAVAAASAHMSSSGSGSSSPHKRSPSTNMLETMAVWLPQYIQSTSASIPTEFYQLLPFFCQFIGTETDEEVSQACLKALCFLSICYVNSRAIPDVLDMIWKVTQSTSWKAKLSILEFLQVFVFTNFMSLCLHPELVKRAEDITVHLLSDENANVQQKASKVLGGMVHSKFLNDEYQTILLQKFRNKINPEVVTQPLGESEPPKKKRKRTNTESSSKSQDLNRMLAADRGAMADFHSGILGLCAMVEAYPYDVPPFMPEVLMELERHLHDPQPIPKTIKKTLQEFKRTHQDNWAEHKLKFTDDQLLVMTDLLVSPNYYA